MAENAVGEKPAENRREIDERGVEAVDLRGERLDVERAERNLDEPAKARKPDHAVDVLGAQQILHHVEHEQRAHSIIEKRSHISVATGMKARGWPKRSG